jgi:hypothetical protein
MRRPILPVLAGALVIALGLLGAGCLKPHDTYVCTDSSTCTLGGVQGTCEATGFCSFPDTTCPSGRRYGEYGGDGLMDTCVGGNVPQCANA